MGFDTRGSMPVTCPFACSKNNIPYEGAFIFEILRYGSRGEAWSAVSTTDLTALGWAVNRARPPKARLPSPAPNKHTSTTLTCKVYGSVFCFLSPFSPVVLVVARNTLRKPIVYRAKSRFLKDFNLK